MVTLRNRGDFWKRPFQVDRHTFTAFLCKITTLSHCSKKDKGYVPAQKLRVHVIPTLIKELPLMRLSHLSISSNMMLSVYKVIRLLQEDSLYI